ncbi:TIGR02444 family protein [Ferrimonas gelatinilytica]
MTQTPSADTFWQFSLDLWETGAVSEIALTLQERHGLEPNLLLLALWLQQSGQFLNAGQFRQLEQGHRAWCDQVLIPYRQLRRRAKADLDKVGYQRLLEGELVLERRSQALLLKALAPMKTALSGDNLDACLDALDLPLHRMDLPLSSQLHSLFHDRQGNTPDLDGGTPTDPSTIAPIAKCCPRCGARFDCRAGADCWCFSALPQGTPRLPLDGAAKEEGCLCPACLRDAAARR